MAIATDLIEITYASQTDRGRQRDVNEDFVYAESFRVGTKDNARDWLLLAIADGVGGHLRGEWASKKAVTALAQALPQLLTAVEPGEALRRACEAANAITWREASASGLDGSATTLVAALIDDSDNLWLANVGDSRAYHVQDGLIDQLTQDHSWVEEQVQSGRMTAEEARTSDQRNIITRSVGFAENVEVDIGGPISLHAGERIVLCSDGLHDQMSDDEIAAVTRATTPYDAASRLVDEANERGGPDNISVIVCSLDRPHHSPEAESAGIVGPLNRFWPVVLIVGGAVCVAALTTLVVLAGI